MRYRIGLLLFVLVWPSPVRAGGPETAGRPVFLEPVLHTDTGKPDRLLNRAFAEAVTLRVPAEADWRLSAPDPGVCAKACKVIRIRGQRTPAPRYTITIRELPANRVIGTNRLDVPAGTTIALIADALLIKCSMMLGIRLDVPAAPVRALPPPPAPPPPVRTRPTPPPPPPVAVKRTAPTGKPDRRFGVGIGPGTMVGFDSYFVSMGMEFSALFRISGPFTLRAVWGYQDLGRVEDPEIRYRVMPISILAGAQWTFRWWQIAVFGGGTLFLFWVDFNPDASMVAAERTRVVGMAGGPTLEGRVAVRVHQRVSLGFTMRFTYVVNELKMEFYDGFDLVARFKAAHLVSHPALDVTFRF